MEINNTKKANNIQEKNDSKDDKTITGQIYAKAFELLEKHPEGLRFIDLRSKIEASFPDFHPKTINGCVWKIVQKFPDKIYKPSRGLYRLLKYK